MSRIGSSNYLNFSPYQVSSTFQRSPNSFVSHWFLIQVISSIFNISTFGNTKGIYFSSENMVYNGWFKMYINQEQFQYLTDSTYFKLYPIESKIKISRSRTQENKEYYVYASPDWTPPTGSRIISRISDTLYIVDNLQISEKLRNDPRILKIRPAGKKRSLNRYTSGFLQTKQQISYYKNNIYAPLRPLHEIGLNGTGQIVNVVDSGVDVFNAFFYDPENDLTTITNRTNVNHRKVVRIESIVDNTDDIEGHGTHAAGTLCGSSLCKECGLIQYNGLAPESKLYFSDIGDSKSGDLIGTVDLDEQYKIFQQLNVHVSSNSWGYSTNEPEIQFNYNKAAFEHPDVLYVFASGNDGQYNTINCPANAKNVLSVTSSEIISAANFEMSVTQVDILNDSFKITTREMMGGKIWQNSISPKMLYLNNLSFVQYKGPECNIENCTESDFDYSSLYNNSIVLLNSDDDDVLCIQALKVGFYGALAAIFSPEDYFLRCDETPKIPMILIDNESISDLLKMGDKISIFPSSGTDDPLPSASFAASKGPADSGLRKPDIMAPGSHINSARSHGPELEENMTVSFLYSDNIADKSGTSMATPAISGLATIIVQYFNDGFYPYLMKGTGKSINPTSCLLRALLVNTAEKPENKEKTEKEPLSKHKNDVGYGFPFLQEILGFNKTGLRFADNQSIGSNSHIVYTINIDSNSADLYVTLVYLDPPLSIENENIFFADLDLYVKGPDGLIYHGNNVSDGDTFSCIEKVVFERDIISPEGGEYEIHIVSNNFPISDKKVPFSVVVNGPFNMSDIEKNPLQLKWRIAADDECPNGCGEHGKCVGGICVCDTFYTGIQCNKSVGVLYDGDSVEYDMFYDDVKYFIVKINESLSNVESVSFDIVKSDNLGLLYFCTSIDNSSEKFTSSIWDCRFACPPNVSDPEEEPEVEDYPFFENVTVFVPQGEDHQFFRIAVYTGNYEKLKVSINNVKVVGHLANMTETQSISSSETQSISESQMTETQSISESSLPSSQITESKTNSESQITETHSYSESSLPTSHISVSQTNSESSLPSSTMTESKTPIITSIPIRENKIPMIAIICLSFVAVFVIVAIILLVVIILIKKKDGRILNSSLNVKLIADNDVSAF